MTEPRRLYRVRFAQQGQVYEVYAREVSHGALLGFVEIGKLVFGERSTVVVDPSEEKLRTEFEGVERFYVPAHQVIRIDEVDKRGPARVMAGDGSTSKVTPLPVFTPGGSGR
jgi:hypothetical protein